MEADSTTAKIVTYLLNCQSIKFEQNAKYKLTEFVVKYGMTLIEESMKYSAHANRDFIDGDDVRLAIKNSREKSSRLDVKDLEEAEKLKVKLQIKEIKETPSIHLGAQELENMKPLKHLVTYNDLNQNRPEGEPRVGLQPQAEASTNPERDFSFGAKKIKVDSAFLQ